MWLDILVIALKRLRYFAIYLATVRVKTHRDSLRLWLGFYLLTYPELQDR